MKRSIAVFRFVLWLVVLSAVALPAAAGALVVRDNDQDVSGGVLRLGGAEEDCCDPGPCHGNFRLDNTGTRDLDRVLFSVSALQGPGPSLPASLLSFAPASLPKLGENGTKIITLKITVPAGTAAGTWRGTVTAAEDKAEGGERVSLPVEVVVCGASAEPELALVAGLGEYDGTRFELKAGSEGCSGSVFAGSVTVENRGAADATETAASLAGFPPGVIARVTPAVVAIPAGGRTVFAVELTVPAGLAAGTYAAELGVRDAASAAQASAPAMFERCAGPAPVELRISEPDGGLRFTAGPQGCSGMRFQAEIAIESVGERTASAARLSVSGLPAGVQVRVEPQQAVIAAGARATFRVNLLVPPELAAGTWVASANAVDSGSGARDSAAVTLSKCAAGAAALRLVALDGGEGAPIEFAPGDSGCGGTTFTTAFAVESTGSLAIARVALSARDFPAGTQVRFVPDLFRLEPGARVNVAATLTSIATQPPGMAQGSLLASPGLALTPARAQAWFARCDATPAGAVKIVLGEGAEAIEFAAAADGCAGDRFAATVVVENSGERVLSAVELAVSGGPAALVYSIEPRSAVIAAGARASFRVTASGAKSAPAGTLLASVMARDAVSGSADSRLARLVRCAGPVIDPTPETPRDPQSEDPRTGDVRFALEHRASKPAARSGEVVTLECTVRNVGSATARVVELKEQLPAGLAYVPGRSAIDGRAAGDPATGNPGGTTTLRWDLGVLAAGAERTLAFQVVVTLSAAPGKASVFATARSGEFVAGPFEAAVEITRGSLRPFGEVRGVVRYDGGPPAPGVRLLLDSDREIVSDEDGRFVFDGVLGGEHLVSLDDRTLVVGDRVIGDDSRMFRLFDGATEEVEFVLRARPQPTLALFRMQGAADK